MSHFTVAVIGENVTEQLATYDENLEVEQYSKYLDEDEVVDMFKFYKEKKKVNIETVADLVEYMEDWSGNEGFYDEETNQLGYYSTYNPDSKWDWYQVGGRWSGMLKLKEGRNGSLGELGLMTESPDVGWVDSARMGDIDWESMREESRKSAENHWKEAQKEKDSTMNYFRYGIDKNTTKEEYIAQASRFGVFAILKDGKWYERGEMGWWGMTRNEKEPREWEDFIRETFDNLSDSDLITIVDCHI